MNEIKFEWDEHKNQINIRKHGISFEDASGAFYDEYAITIDDPDHSVDEYRFIVIGCSFSNHIVTVCHCDRREDVIRIISARRATKSETTTYYENLRGFFE